MNHPSTAHAFADPQPGANEVASREPASDFEQVLQPQASTLSLRGAGTAAALAAAQEPQAAAEVVGREPPADFEVTIPPPGATAQSYGYAGGNGYSTQRDAKVGVAVAALTYRIATDAVLSSSSDITYDLEKMEGIRYPDNDAARWGASSGTFRAGACLLYTSDAADE